MKTTPFAPIFSIGLALFTLSVSAQEAPSLSLPVAAEPEPSAPPSARAASAPSARAETGLRFNFRGAPLEMVLNYMSEAAGFIIVLDSPVHGTVDMWSTQPVSKEEAVQLLNIALNKNGYSASVQGRNLVVSSKEDAKKRNIPIHTGNDPQEIPLTAEMVMQIIPLRNIDATQAARDLGTLLPGSATLTANVDSNSLVVTDTQINIHHIVEMVAALDTSMQSESAMRVFHLKNADPVEMAQLLTNLYQSPTNGGNNNNNNRGFGGGGPAAFFGGAFGGGFPGAGGFGGAGGGVPGAGGGGVGGGGGGGGGGRGGRGNNNGQSRRQTPVTAVADPRTFSLIVTASKDAMPQIAEMISQLDSSPGRKQRVYVYTMENGDVHQAETILKNLFQSSNGRSSTSTQTDPLSTRASSNAQSSSSANSTLNSNSSLSRTTR